MKDTYIIVIEMNIEKLNQVICRIDSAYQRVMYADHTKVEEVKEKLQYIHALWDKVNFGFLTPDSEIISAIEGLLTRNIITLDEYQDLINGVES